MTRNVGLVIVFLCSMVCSAMGQRVHQVAKTRNLPAGAPTASDVIMRSLRLRTASDSSQHDTRRALSDFHVTRLEWTYVRDADFIAQVRGSGRMFGGAASSALSHIVKVDGEQDDKDLVCVNLDGVPVVPTWKRAWRPPGNWWICVNNPMVERAYVQYLESCIDAGAQIMQRDEPSGNASAVAWGGCFCQHCMAGFREYLADNTTPEQQRQMGIQDARPFDYAQYLREQQAPVGDAFGRSGGGELKELFLQFQTEATIAFHHRTRKELDDYAGRRVPFSCNNGCRHWTAVELAYDWCFGELSYRHATPGFLLDAMRTAHAQGRCQVVTMPKKRDREDLEAWHRRTRQTIAMAYAAGGHCMVPWDVYMPGDAPRYFGTPPQYADLYGFIRGVGQYLDGYEYAGAFGPQIESDLYSDAPPVRLPGDREVHAVIRARPGQANGAVAIHLVDWSDHPRSFDVQLDATRLFGERPLRLQLLTPTVYDRDAHERADAKRSYAELVATHQMGCDYTSALSLPALTPWGLLIIQPAPAASVGVWQPIIWPEPATQFRESLVVHMKSATRNACLHFTTDGSPPSVESPIYRSPLRLPQSATVRAIAAAPGGRRSSEASVTFQKRSDTAVPMPPNSASLRPRLKLWLRADALSLPDGAPVETWTASAGPNALASPHRTLDDTVTAPPTFRANAVRGRPAISFDGIDDSLVVPNFATENLAGSAFTVFMVTQSETDGFGICGNGIWGGGGIPRLYLQRSAYRYGELTNVVNLHPNDTGPTISVFMHDGVQTMTAATDGRPSDRLSGVPVVAEFGSGGNLAMPFWGGNKNCAGDIAEIVVYDCELTGAQREGVEAHLADKYGIQYAKRWK